MQPHAAKGQGSLFDMLHQSRGSWSCSAWRRWQLRQQLGVWGKAGQLGAWGKAGQTSLQHRR
eukprot:247684-Pelagomonas_calceolata.AAC.2